MNKELLRTLGRLVELGKMTKEEALRTFLDEAIEDFAPMIDALHNVACVKEHACDPAHLKSRIDGVCYYELEAQLHDSWQFRDHREWVEVFYQITIECGYEKVQDVVSAIGALNANLQLIAAKSPSAMAIARGILSAADSSPAADSRSESLDAAVDTQHRARSR